MPNLYAIELKGTRGSLFADVPARSLNFALALAATRIGQAVKPAVRAEMLRAFDRPNPFTLGSLQLVTAKKTDAEPRAFVWFKDPAGSFIAPGENAASILPARRHYLLPQVFGGNRPAKRMELRLRRIGALGPGGFAVPGWGAKLDRYGNLSGGEVVQALAAIGGFGDVGGLRNSTPQTLAKLASGRRTGTPTTYFLVKAARGQLEAGLYRRVGGRRARIEQVLRFIRTPNYRPRFDFYGVADRAAEKAAPGALAEAVATALRPRTTR